MPYRMITDSLLRKATLLFVLPAYGTACYAEHRLAIKQLVDDIYY